ncbi:hypothetical protein HKX48_004520 [Thoreauomyces humboldtii]|nr:hypothetical protein HKX48_004520 [Thoreauomyces humboldtii]
MKDLGSQHHSVIDVETSIHKHDRGIPDKPDRRESLPNVHHDDDKDAVTIDISQQQPDSVNNNAEGLRHRGKKNLEDRSGKAHHEDMEIYWEDVKYAIQTGSGKEKKERQILHGDRGRAKPGEIVALMGGSGAGKTTLLNILAGRVAAGEPTGKILANGKVRDRRTWKRTVGYVEQEDLLYENLTVRETLATAAMLRLPSKLYTKAEKLARVETVMEQLGIAHVADSRIGSPATGGISGGEKKRVSIGVELVTDPGTLFLDEPTTGLDSNTANSIVEMMKGFATKTGKTIIMTIHMPRETILDMIDKVALISKGRMVWFGPAKDALAHFENLGHKCPKQTNPADFFLDLISVDNRDKKSQGKVDNLISEWDKVETDYIPPIDDGVRQDATNTQDAMNTKAGRAEVADSWKDSVDGDRWATSWFSEFTVLLQRNFKQTIRNRTIVISGFGQQFIMMLLLGFVFFRIKDDQASVQNRQGVLFFLCINQTFSFLMPIITVWPLERRIILRERASGSYRTSAVYLAKAVSQWPLAALSSLLFSIPVYWLIGLHPTFVRWLLFQVITQCLVLAAQSLGMLIGSSVPNVQMAQVFGPLVVVMFVVFGGNFANQDSITVVLRWIQWLSLIRYAYGAYMQNEFNGLTFQCSGGSSGASSSCNPQGEAIVASFGLNTPSVGICILVLLALAVAFQVLAALVLRKTTRMRMRII